MRDFFKVARHYFTEESTQEMLDRWQHMMCPHDRSICQVTKYYMLFLPTTSKIPPDKSWKQWVPDLNMFWKTWSNSPNWEVDILKLFARLSIHQVGGFIKKNIKKYFVFLVEGVGGVERHGAIICLGCIFGVLEVTTLEISKTRCITE